MKKSDTFKTSTFYGAGEIIFAKKNGEKNHHIFQNLLNQKL